MLVWTAVGRSRRSSAAGQGGGPSPSRASRAKVQRLTQARAPRPVALRGRLYRASNPIAPHEPGGERRVVTRPRRLARPGDLCGPQRHLQPAGLPVVVALRQRPEYRITATRLPGTSRSYTCGSIGSGAAACFTPFGRTTRTTQPPTAADCVTGAVVSSRTDAAAWVTLAVVSNFCSPCSCQR